MRANLYSVEWDQKTHRINGKENVISSSFFAKETQSHQPGNKTVHKAF